MSTVRNGIQLQTGLGGSNPTRTAAQRETVRHIKAPIPNNIVHWRQSIGGNVNGKDIYHESNNLPFLKNGVSW